MPTIFHCLDAISQDSAAEEGAILPGNITDDEDKPRYRKAKKAEGVSTKPANLRYVIYLFGKTAEGAYLRLQVNGFQPYFYVGLDKLPFETFKYELNSLLKSQKRWLQSLVTCELVSKQVLYGYTGGASYRFARLSVPSICAFRALKRFFLTGDTNEPIFRVGAADPLKVYEANLDPMLRFFHLRDIKPSGWVTVDAETSQEVEGDGYYDSDMGLFIKNPNAGMPCPWAVETLEVNWDEVNPTTGPVPAAPFINAVWDIECFSDNGEFTVAKRGYTRLAQQIYALAETPEAAAQLIYDAATGFPAEGMDTLRHKDVLVEKALEAALAGSVFRDGLAPLLKKKEGLSVASKKDRITDISAILAKVLRASLPLAGDPIIQIGTVLAVGPTVTEKHIFVFHEDGTCDPVPGAILHKFRTERGLILGWTKFIGERNPDILTGYNVFGYDEKYVWDRAAELGIQENDYVQQLSRMTDLGKGVTLEEKFLSSSAMGDNTLYMLTMTGRLQIDLFHYVKRNFSLPAYKLDYVCQHFMSGKCGRVDTSAATEWVIPTKNTGDVIVGRYLVLLDESGDNLVDKLKVIRIDDKKSLTVTAPTGDDVEDLKGTVQDAVKWAVVKDDVSPQDIFRFHRDGGAAGRSTVAAYCIQDCDLTFELLKKLDVFNNAMAMANTCSVPIGMIFTRGQGVKIESLIFKECDKRGQCVEVMRTQPYDADTPPQGDGDSYEGAIVLTPTPGVYTESPIGVADFASLYPSTIMSENISYDTLLWVKRYTIGPNGRPGTYLGLDYGTDTAPVEPGVLWTDIEFDVWGVKEGDTRKDPEKEKKAIRVCRYAQLPDGRKGTLPQIVQGLLSARKAKRKEAEKETDPFKKALLDAEQLAYKLTANSLYGQLGSGTFKIRLQHLAASVTAYGRKQIMFAKEAIETFYGPAAGRPDCAAHTVYGDTDSLFIDFKVRDPATGVPLKGEAAIKATMALTEEAGKFVTRCLRDPHDFEYDKVFYPFIIFSKKRYVGNKYEESATDFYQNSMGIATKRRDYAGIVKVIYGGALRIMLMERNPVGAAEFVKKKLMDLAQGRVSMTQLTLTKSLAAEYKAATPPAHKMLAERIAARDPGNAPASGDRISFLYIIPPAAVHNSNLQGDRIETPSFIKEKGFHVDSKYYIEHQLINPISQLFALVVEQLPGCVAPKGKTWATATESDREWAATDYLFKASLDECDKRAKPTLLLIAAEARKLESVAQKVGFASLFGTSISSSMATTARRSPRLATPVTPVAKHVQAKLKFGPMPVAVQRALIEAAEKSVKGGKSPPKEK
jgi:DNA polymerase elongation subunit (family B)